MQSLKVVISPKAATELARIVDYNRTKYGDTRADNYRSFLMGAINRLSKSYEKGRPVEEFPEFRGMLLKRRSQGDGHVLIYEIRLDLSEIHVLHVFHTKMDILGRLRQE